MAAALVPMICLVNRTPDRIPADVIVEGQEKKIDGASIKGATPAATDSKV